MLKVKVCGMSEPGNVADVARLAPDYMGFIFHEPSPRNALGVKPETVTSLPPGTQAVAVTVDRDEGFLIDLAETYGFRIFQLHGSESPDLCDRLRRCGMTVWKALGADGTLSEKALQYAGHADMILLDTPSAKQGGTGRKFDWSLLDLMPQGIRFMLSGGIGPDDAAEILRVSRPELAGVDLNSRFETEPGRKDSGLLARFITSIR